MPFSYLYTPENNLLAIIGSGAVEMTDRIHCLSRIFSDPTLPAACLILINVSRTSNCPTPGEIQDIARLNERLLERFGGPIAMVNDRIELLTASRLIAFATLAENAKVQVFRTEAAALAWLGC